MLRFRIRINQGIDPLSMERMHVILDIPPMETIQTIAISHFELKLWSPMLNLFVQDVIPAVSTTPLPSLALDELQERGWVYPVGSSHRG